MIVAAGVFVELEPEDQDVGESLTIAFSEDSGVTCAWTVEVYPVLKTGRFFLGRADVPAAVAGVQSARVVAIANVPGAIGWRVVVHGDPTSTARADWQLGTSKCCGGVPGLTVISPPSPPRP